MHSKKDVIKKGSFRVDLYGATIHIYLCANPDSILTVGNRIIRRYKEETVDYPVHALSFTPDLKGDSYYLFFSPDDLSVNTITHETDHIRNYIVDYYNISENTNSQENSANLNGYINQMVFRFIKKCGYSIE